MPPIYSLTSFVAALSIASATPTLSLRGQALNTIVNYHNLGEDFINFAPNWPTCANDKNLYDIGLSLSATVNVRPDCDTVIDKICIAAEAMANMSSTTQFMYQLGHTEGTCEGHIMFSHVKLSDPLTYDICAQNFQSVTNTCMLLDPTVKNYAKLQYQAGVQNIFYDPAADNSPTFWKWSASTVWNAMPGYMMGPLGCFGTVISHDSDDIQVDGTLKPGTG